MNRQSNIPTKLRALHMRMPVFVVVVAGFALVFWAWKFNRANRDPARASMTLELNRLSREADPTVRRNAALVLGDVAPELAAETVEPLLIAATRDADPKVRAASVSALVHVLSGNAWERTGEEMATQVDRALPALVSLLDDNDAAVRIQTATAIGITVANLARARGGKVDKEIALATKALVKRLERDPDETARIMAVQALLLMRVEVQVPAPPPAGKMVTLAVSPDPALVTPPLEAALRRERSRKILDVVVEAIIKFHPVPKEAPPSLLPLIRPGNPQPVRVVLLRGLSHLHMPFRLVVGGWTNSDDLWPLEVAILRDGTMEEKFEARDLLNQSLRPPPASIVPKLVDLLTTPGVPYRDRIAYVLQTSPIKPDAGAVQQAAELIGKHALDEQARGNQGSAMVLSLLGHETTESAEVRRNLAAELRRKIAECPVDRGPGFTDDGSVIDYRGETPRNANEIAGILANFGPNAVDVVPELMAIFRENRDARARDLLADIFAQIGPGARTALPLLKERTHTELRLLDGETIQIAKTFTDRRDSPLISSAFAMYAIDPRAPETRSLVVPMAMVSAHALKTNYRTAAEEWLIKMIELDSSLLREIRNAAASRNHPQERAELLKILRDFSSRGITAQEKSDAL